MTPDPFAFDRTAVSVYRLGEEPSDRDYWLTRPVEERLAAVEFLRAQYHDWPNDSRPQLPRVLRVTRRA